MNFYLKVEPAGEFATGVVPKGTLEKVKAMEEWEQQNYLAEIQSEEKEENNVVRTFGIPLFINGTMDNTEEVKQIILNELDLPNKELIKFEIDYRRPDDKYLDYEKYEIFVFTEYSKYSCEFNIDLKDDEIDPSKITIKLAFLEFHAEMHPDDVETYWMLESMEYNDEENYTEMELIDRGIEVFASIGDDLEYEEFKN